MFDSRTKIDPVDKKHKQCIKKIPFNDGQGKNTRKERGKKKKKEIFEAKIAPLNETMQDWLNPETKWRNI